MLVDDEDLARLRRALDTAGMGIADERKVLVVDVEDRPGTLGELTRRLAAANVNVDLAYTTFGGVRLVVAFAWWSPPTTCAAPAPRSAGQPSKVQRAAVRCRRPQACSGTCSTSTSPARPTLARSAASRRGEDAVGSLDLGTEDYASMQRS